MSLETSLSFSIVTVTRNNLPGLRKTLESVQVQTDRDFEWIVIDGASEDGTVCFLETNRPDLDFPCRFVSEPDQGIYDAMNKGLARAKGDYVLFLNAGDCLADPSVLETVHRCVAEGAFDLIYGDAWEERDGQPSVLKPARSHTELARGLFTHHQAIFYRRAALRGLQYNITYAIAADYDFTVAVLARASAVRYLSYPICVFERGGVSQRHVRRGRAEQYRIRAARGMVSAPVNGWIYVLQAVASALKVSLPGAYWRFRNFLVSRAMAR